VLRQATEWFEAPRYRVQSDHLTKGKIVAYGSNSLSTSFPKLSYYYYYYYYYKDEYCSHKQGWVKGYSMSGHDTDSHLEISLKDGRLCCRVSNGYSRQPLHGLQVGQLGPGIKSCALE
jgi:hypothetical protein